MSAPTVRRLRRVLVANRGEIAVRIVRACRDLGLEVVAVYSDADAGAAHVRLADEAVRLGPPPPAESYLRIEAIVEAALRTGADAVHPGYGFLAERADFARAVEAAGLVFVGPSAAAIELLGNKLNARRLASRVGVPVVPGTLEPAPVDRADRVDALVEAARGVGFPLLVKAAAGGGGRGMRRVERPDDLPAALATAAAEAAGAFGIGDVYLEREIRPARHVEVQLLGDAAGTVVALGERDCSIQRRHQKLVEEAPAPGLTPEERRRLHDLAVRLGRAAGLTNAATVEFLMAPDRSFAFLEVNTRLQVEHGVTELVSGVDIVATQLRIAAGEPLPETVLAAAAEAPAPRAHAIEVRITAEDPGRDFAPTPGRVGRWTMPAGPGVRVDAALEPGDRIPPEYDNLVAKLLVVGADRAAAIDRLRRALDEVEITGVQTTLPFHRFVARSPSFRGGELSTDWVAEHWDGESERSLVVRRALLAAGLAALTEEEASSARPDAGTGAGVAPSPPRASAPPAAPRHGPVREPPSPWARAGRLAAIDRWPT